MKTTKDFIDSIVNDYNNEIDGWFPSITPQMGTIMWQNIHNLDSFVAYATPNWKRLGEVDLQFQDENGDMIEYNHSFNAETKKEYFFMLNLILKGVESEYNIDEKV